ncbi:hypothetical protein HYV49_04965 [Candidatus Pacearchaeota archaeon]|nr:hypothetical protein [Candidatus Pacearchaeota archaeon]
MENQDEINKKEKEIYEGFSDEEKQNSKKVLESLTKEEKRVLMIMQSGLSFDEIAEKSGFNPDKLDLILESLEKKRLIFGKDTNEYNNQFGRGLTYSLGLFISYEGNFERYLSEALVIETNDLFEWPYDPRKADPKTRATAEKKIRKVKKKIEGPTSVRWFSESEIYIRNIEIPTSLHNEIQERLRELRTKCHNWAFPKDTEKFPKSENVYWALEEAKELLRLIDEHHGIKTFKAKNNLN